MRADHTSDASDIDYSASAGAGTAACQVAAAGDGAVAPGIVAIITGCPTSIALLGFACQVARAKTVQHPMRSAAKIAAAPGKPSRFCTVLV